MLVLLFVAGCGRGKEESASRVSSGICWDSQLRQAIDFRTQAEWSSPTIKAKVFSSAKDSGKTMLAHLAPEVLGDMDYGFFSEVTTNKDGFNATLAEFTGPGVVTWVWSANPVGTLNLYVDSADHPVLSMPFAEFLEGGFLPVREPFGSITSRGYNLHFPIAHARFCKLVLNVPRLQDLAKLYYQVAWKSAPPDTAIQPFDVAAIQHEARTLRSIAKEFFAIAGAAAPSEHLGEPQRVECSLEQGKAFEVFQAKGPQAVVAIRFSGRTKSDLAGLWVEGFWDGKNAVNAPLHMLAGVSSLMENTRSLPATVDGSAACLRWFMPFASEGRIRCTNATNYQCRFTVETWTQPMDASRYPLRFHANFSKYEKLRTDAGNLLTFVDAPGPGRFVGCVLDVDSRSDQWWGEGDNLIWLDGTNCPAVHGTGTEDYFGFAWCSPVTFNHPFRGQTRVVRSQYHWFSSMHRYHLLDQLPYQQRGRFQFQALGLGTGDMDWMATVIWYEEGSS